MANQLGKFAPHLSETTKPLRDLISHKSHFVWGPPQEMAFKAVKQLASSEPVLALYNFNKETDSSDSTDSSALGLGAILFQYQTNGELKQVAYASRVFSEPEKHCSQIEEALAVTWACESLITIYQGSYFIFKQTTSLLCHC